MELETPIDICHRCLRSLGGSFFPEKRTDNRKCHLCHFITTTQHFTLKFVDDWPPTKEDDDES